LSKALPERIHNVLRIAPKQTSFEGLKHLITQIDQRHWEDQATLATARRSGEASAAPGTSRWPRPLFPHNSTGKPPARPGINPHTPGAPSGDQNPHPVARPNAQQAAESTLTSSPPPFYNFVHWPPLRTLVLLPSLPAPPNRSSSTPSSLTPPTLSPPPRRSSTVA
ncbi:hypothetical protein C0992_008984, partial [Termitomyces sp. T32_za158]